MTSPLIGLALFLLGCSHPILQSTSAEIHAILAFQKRFTGRAVIQFFQEMWFFGRTSFALAVLILLTCLSWRKGLVAISGFALAVSFEWIIKKFFKRPRPFRVEQEIAMLQPLEPLDSSFPSGDALRIWFLTLILSTLLSSLPFSIAAAALAVTVSLGRILMGVHYFSDVLAGAGLGVLAAGATVWLWQIFRLIG